MPSLVIFGKGRTTFWVEQDGVARMLTFVEYDFTTAASGFIPKFTLLPDNGTNITAFVLLWRNTDCDPNLGNICPNYVQLVVANDFANPQSRGFTEVSNNFTILFEDNFINNGGVIQPQNIPIAKAETLVHEFGHQFGLIPISEGGTEPAIHDTSSTDYPNHEIPSTDQGVMTYDRNFENGIAEFYINCINHIRSFEDGI